MPKQEVATRLLGMTITDKKRVTEYVSAFSFFSTKIVNVESNFLPRIPGTIQGFKSLRPRKLKQSTPALLSTEFIDKSDSKRQCFQSLYL